jgi:hypothetical protein
MRDAKIFGRWPERLALMDLASRSGVDEDVLLHRAIRQFVAGELAKLEAEQRPTDRAADAHPTCRGCDND